MFRLPKNKEECAKWMKNLPYKNLHTSANSVICEVHWPSNYATVTLRGKTRPKDSLSVWPGVPTSCILTPTHMGVRISNPWLYKNNITQLQSWSLIEELVRHLNTYEVSHHMNVIHEQMSSISSCSVGKKMYSPNAFVRAFEYFSMSRSLYKKLRNDFQLPYISTLQRITSRVTKEDVTQLLTHVFQPLHDKQKICILLHDEVYVKKC